MRTLGYVLAFIVFIGGPDQTQAVFHRSGRQTASAATEDMLATTVWSPASALELRCRVTQQQAKGSEGLSTRVLAISRRSGESSVEVFRYETADFFLGMLPLGEIDGRLMTVWLSGTGYRIRVFAYDHAKILNVLEKSSKGFPEIIFDAGGAESILITEMTFRKGEWTPAGGSTEVYKWAGRAYNVLGRVPWERRFECRSPETCTTIRDGQKRQF